ncbi:MAG: hypothetical protein H8E38_06525 [SAR324 cluster bacterium]|nr:hypothetical protein [SAR324 cluster bacterium]
MILNYDFQQGVHLYRLQGKMNSDDLKQLQQVVNSQLEPLSGDVIHFTFDCTELENTTAPKVKIQGE